MAPTLPQLRLALRRVVRRMRFRATVYALFGVGAALLGAPVRPWIPDGVAGIARAPSVGHQLTILAASMLAVTTFSLSIMVAAYASASSGATPRATRLLIADSSAQSALATFIGAFLFSVVGLIALSTGLYGDGGRVVLFAATVLVIALITLTLLRWIDQLSSFGRVGATIQLVEDATAKAIRAHLRDPWLGGAPGARDVQAGAQPVAAGGVGYVEHVDVERLSVLASQAGGVVHVAIRPGGLASPGRPLAWYDGPGFDRALADGVRSAFTLGTQRSFEQDPRFGFVVLAEIGSRALSTATNDPGTAIDVLVTVTRLLCGWAGAGAAPVEPRHPRVFVPPVDVPDVFEDVFPQLARDGAGLLEIGIHLQKTLAAVASCGHPAFAEAARVHAGHALARGLAAIDFEPDRDALLRSIPRLPESA